MVGYLGNHLLPARAGEGLRLFWLHRCTGRDAAGIVATMVVERLVDRLVLSGALGLAFLAIRPQLLPWQFQAVVIGFVLAGLVGMGLIQMRSRLQGWAGYGWLDPLLTGLGQTGEQMPRVVLWSLGMWGLPA